MHQYVSGSIFLDDKSLKKNPLKIIFKNKFNSNSKYLFHTYVQATVPMCVCMCIYVCVHMCVGIHMCVCVFSFGFQNQPYKAATIITPVYG